MPVEMSNPLAADLDLILHHTQGWEELREQKIFITGGTGFFGCWLLESFAWANENLKLNASAVVLTRDLNAFKQKAPHLAARSDIKFHIGDVRSFEPAEGKFSYIIHAATEVNHRWNQEDPLLALDVIVEGTRHTLEVARSWGTPKFLLTSSGAVYGNPPTDVTHICEEYAGAPDTMNSRSVYGEGKRLAELLCTLYAKQYRIEAKIARCFAFVGPYLPLDTQLAIGNFMRNGIKGLPILVQGDGTPYRSYLYAADLAIWLWTILLRGESCRPYNVGSESAISIADLARLTAEIGGNAEVSVAKEAIAGRPIERYVPSVQRAARELQLQQIISLPEAIKRTMLWYSKPN